MSIFYTGDWHAIGSEYYRKVELYSMGWSPQVDIENYSVVCASYGGPLAIIKDDKKFLRVTQNVPAKPIISIFTSAGTLISSIKVIHLIRSSSSVICFAGYLIVSMSISFASLLMLEFSYRYE